MWARGVGCLAELAIALCVVVGGAVPARAQGAAADALVSQAKAAAAASNCNRAIDLGERAATSDPSDVAAYEVLADCFARTGKFDDELRIFSRAVSAVPAYANGWFHLGYALRKSNRLQEAAACYRRAADLAPGEPDPWFGLALTYKALGERDAAVQSYERYVALEKRPGQAQWVTKARAEMEALRAAGAKGSPDAGATAPALPVASATSPPVAPGAAPAAAPPSPPAAVAVAQPAPAPPVARAPIPTLPASLPAESTGSRAARFKSAGDAAQAAGRLPEAVHDYREAIDANPKYADAHVALGTVFLRQSRYPAAAGELQAALVIDPVYALAWVELGDAQIGAGQAKEAVRSYARAESLMPRDPDVWLGSARAAEAAGYPKEAAADYGKYLALETRAEHATDVAAARAALARLSGEAPPQPTGVVPATEPSITTAAAPPPAPARSLVTPPDAISRGDAEFAAGRYAEAAAAYRMAATWDPAVLSRAPSLEESVECRYREGVALALSGDLWSAVGAWELTLELDPGYSPARVALARVEAHLGTGARGVAAVLRGPASGSTRPPVLERASVQVAAGEDASARTLLDSYLAAHADDAAAYELRGRARAALLDERGALADFLRAIGNDPHRTSSYRLAAESAARLGKRDQAHYLARLYADGGAEDAKGELARIDSLLASAPLWDEGADVEPVKDLPAGLAPVEFPGGTSAPPAQPFDSSRLDLPDPAAARSVSGTAASTALDPDALDLPDPPLTSPSSGRRTPHVSAGAYDTDSPDPPGTSIPSLKAKDTKAPPASGYDTDRPEPP